MQDAVIVATARTPIGRAYKGSLTGERPDDMAGFVVAEMLSGVPDLDPAEIEDVIVGCAMTQGESGYNVARQASLLAGLPDTVPGTTVNRNCASSLQAIRIAAHAVMAGEGDVFVAAGVESVSRVMGSGFSTDHIHPRFLDPSRDDFINHVFMPMGLTAENVAEQYGVTRDRMDEFAKRSQDLAVESQDNGFFDREIVPYPTTAGTVVGRDDGPRPNTTIERLAELQPAFVPGGTVTAGNSCPLNDGAAAVLVMSESRASELGLAPKARIVASAVSGLAPEIMGVGPIEAVRKVLDRAGMTIDDLDVIELNEAFAAQVLAVADQLAIPVEKLNPHGGAIALGHPFGMTGARMMTTLINGLETGDHTLGLETMCVGGGQGMAMIVERVG